MVLVSLQDSDSALNFGSMPRWGKLSHEKTPLYLDAVRISDFLYVFQIDAQTCCRTPCVQNHTAARSLRFIRAFISRTRFEPVIRVFDGPETVSAMEDRNRQTQVRQ
jgi:hypothetical protein